MIWKWVLLHRLYCMWHKPEMTCIIHQTIRAAVCEYGLRRLQKYVHSSTDISYDLDENKNLAILPKFCTAPFQNSQWVHKSLHLRGIIYHLLNCEKSYINHFQTRNPSLTSPSFQDGQSSFMFGQWMPKKKNSISWKNWSELQRK